MQQAIVAVEDRRFYEHNGVDLRGIGARRLGGRRKQEGRAGRIDDHPAVRQELVRTSAADDQPEAEGGRARLAARTALAEAADPHRLPEHDLLRERRLRHPAGRPDVLQHDRGEADTPAGGFAGRDPRGSLPLRPGRNPKTARARRLEVLKAMFASKRSSAPISDVPRVHRCPARRTCTSGDSGARALLRQLREAAVDREVRNAARLRRRPQRPVDDRPATAETCATSDREVLKEPNGPSAALVAIRPRTGEVVAMYGGDNFRQSQFNLAVQGERQPGSSFKPFVLATALKQGISPVDDLSVEAGLDLHRRQVLAGAQLRERLHRLGRPRDGDGGVGQQHLRAADPAGRTGQRRADRTRSRYHPASESRTSRSASAQTPSARSRWRARSRRSRTAAAVWTSSGSGTAPARSRASATPQGKIVDDNRPVNRAVLDSDRRAADQHPRRRRRSGTGKRAALPDRTVAGKTDDGELR